MIIDGGEITKRINMDDWVGIAVEGNPDQPQYQSQQGYLEIKNQGKISYAREAILNYGPGTGDEWYDWSSRGGMIVATDAIFLNNRRDVALVSYYNSGGQYNGRYHAVFTDCQFLRDQNFKANAMLPSITMWDVEGVQFYNCNFENTNQDAFEHAGGGISTIDASYKLHENPTGMGCRFYRYAEAIRSENISKPQAQFPITIVGTYFYRNIHAIYLKNTQFAKIAYNDFMVNKNYNYSPIGGGFQSSAYGLYLDGSSLFEVYDNTLETEGWSNPSAGIVIKDAGGSAHQLYHNTLDKFEVGLEAIGINQNSSDPAIGLTFKCNDLGYTDPNGTDIYTQGPVASAQGNQSNLPNNLFSPSTAGISFFNGQASSIVYPYGQGEPRVIPGNPGVTGAEQGLTKKAENTFANFSSNCTPLPKPPIANPNGTGQELLNAESLLGQDRTLRAQLIDQGNTPALEAQILFSIDQSDFQDLYIDLMGMAPDVSVDNLLNVAQLEYYPELALRNIMVANPHGPRDGEVWDALLNHNPPLSQQTLDDMESGSQTITSKDILDMRIAANQQKSEHATRLLVEYYANEMAVGNGNHGQDLKDLLKDRDESHYRYALVDLYLGEGNTTAASSELALVPGECELGEEEEAEYNSMDQFYDVVINVLNTEEGRMDQVSETDLGSLQQIVASGSGIAVGRAQSLLKLNGEEINYVEPVYFPGSSQKRALEPEAVRPNKPISSFKLWPNPATNYTILQWNWFEAGLTEGFAVMVYDIQGQLVSKVEVPDPQVNTRMLSTKGMAPGVYLVNLVQGESVLESFKLSVD